MFIYLYKNKEGHIKGFQSHLQRPSEWKKDNLRVIPDEDYQFLRLFLTGREHVKEVKKTGTGVISIGDGLHLVDEGDVIKAHQKTQREVLDRQGIVIKTTL